MATTEIAASNVSMVYEGHKRETVTALQNVSFEIAKGEFVSLLGHLAAARPLCCASSQIYSNRHRVRCIYVAARRVRQDGS